MQPYDKGIAVLSDSKDFWLKCVLFKKKNQILEHCLFLKIKKFLVFIL